jgi:NitT/TauT family transport system substrate-binding protein
MIVTRRLFALVLAAFAGLSAPDCRPAHAEGRIRLVEQFGTVYLPLHVIRDQKLIEKHGEALGLDIQVEWAKLSGGAAVNDALLAGAVDVASAGAGPFLTLWDRTRGAVKIIGALGAQPNDLLSNNPAVKSLKDFTKADRIAVPAAIVSVQSRILQMAAEQEFGVGKHAVLDDITVTLPHPDAAAALISGATEITAHFSNPPYQDEEARSPKVHKVLSSYDVLGGPVTSTFVYGTVKFRNENPKTFRAFFEALKEATAWIDANKAAAAQTYVRVENSKLDPGFIRSVIENPAVRPTVVPAGSQKFADFLYRTGAIKTKAASWRDYTFEELQDAPGS